MTVTGAGVTSYQYDDWGRLASATAPTWTQQYIYDGFGNLVQKDGDGSGFVAVW